MTSNLGQFRAGKQLKGRDGSKGRYIIGFLGCDRTGWGLKSWYYWHLWRFYSSTIRIFNKFRDFNNGTLRPWQDRSRVHYWASPPGKELKRVPPLQEVLQHQPSPLERLHHFGEHSNEHHYLRKFCSPNTPKNDPHHGKYFRQGN